jgi:hypothetical protein
MFHPQVRMLHMHLPQLLRDMFLFHIHPALRFIHLVLAFIHLLLTACPFPFSAGDKHGLT